MQVAGTPKIRVKIAGPKLAYSITVSMLGNVENSHTHLNFYGSRNSQQLHILVNIEYIKIIKFEATHTSIYLLNVFLKISKPFYHPRYLRLVRLSIVIRSLSSLRRSLL